MIWYQGDHKADQNHHVSGAPGAPKLTQLLVTISRYDNGFIMFDNLFAMVISSFRQRPMKPTLGLMSPSWGERLVLSGYHAASDKIGILTSGINF